MDTEMTPYSMAVPGHRITSLLRFATDMNKWKIQLDIMFMGTAV